MDAQLLRAPGGRVLFLECNGDLVDAIVDTLHKPFGAVLLAAGQGDEGSADQGWSDGALGGLIASVGQLRRTLFKADGQGGLLPRPADLKKVHASARRRHAEGGVEPDWCMWCLSQGRGKVLHPKSSGTCRQCQQPCEKVCASSQVGKCCRAKVLQRQADYNTYHCIACAADGRKSTTSVLRACSACSAWALTCRECALCAACGAAQAGYATGAEPKVAKRAKETVKFLVTNDLRIFESSSVKAFELIAAWSKSLDGVRSQAVRVGPEHLQALLLHALRGSNEVLDHTFPAADHEEVEVANVVSNCPFKLVFDSAAAHTDSFRLASREP